MAKKTHDFSIDFQCYKLKWSLRGLNSIVWSCMQLASCAELHEEGTDPGIQQFLPFPYCSFCCLKHCRLPEKSSQSTPCVSCDPRSALCWSHVAQVQVSFFSSPTQSSHKLVQFKKANSGFDQILPKYLMKKKKQKSTEDALASVASGNYTS